MFHWLINCWVTFLIDRTYSIILSFCPLCTVHVPTSLWTKFRKMFESSHLSKMEKLIQFPSYCTHLNKKTQAAQKIWVTSLASLDHRFKKGKARTDLHDTPDLSKPVCSSENRNDPPFLSSVQVVTDLQQSLFG